MSRRERTLRSAWCARLRDALTATGLPANRIATLAGVSQPVVAKFLTEDGKDLCLSVAERLAGVVNLCLQTRVVNNGDKT